jgi:hypothetical protein
VAALFEDWGAHPGGPPDFDRDGAVGVRDLMELFLRWGPCPGDPPPDWSGEGPGDPVAIWIDAQAGDDSLPGTRAEPRRSLAAASAFLAAHPTGATVYLKGTFRGEALHASPVYHATITKWPGEPRPMIRADRITTGWTPAGLEWEADVGEEVITQVVEDWDARVLPDGRHYGHLRGGTFGSLRPGEWAQGEGDAASLLRVRPSSGEPADHVIGRIAREPRNGISLGADDTIVRGVDTALFCSRHGLAAPGETAGNGIVFNESQRCTIQDCDSWDGGIHCLAFLNDSTDCTVRGCRLYASRSIFGVSHLDMESDARDLRGVVEDCHFACSGLLDWNGTVLDALPDEGDLVAGFFAQTNTDGNITDLVVRRCTFEQFANSPFSISIAIGRQTALPGDDTDPATYPVRIEDCTFRNQGQVGGVGQSVGNGAWAAFVRCRIDATRYATLPTALGFGGILEINDSATPSGFILDSCTMVWAENPLGGSAFAFRAGARPRWLNSLCWSRTAEPESHGVRWFLSVEGGVHAWARGSVFGYRAPHPSHRLWAHDAGMGAANHDFQDCWYVNIAGGSFSDEPGLSTTAAWLANVDPGGIYATDPEIADDPEDPEGLSGGSLQSIVKPLPRHTAVGINGRLYSGHYGPYQYGPAVP